jgi:hypothetical protein
VLFQELIIAADKLLQTLVTASGLQQTLFTAVTVDTVLPHYVYITKNDSAQRTNCRFGAPSLWGPMQQNTLG